RGHGPGKTHFASVEITPSGYEQIKKRLERIEMAKVLDMQERLARKQRAAELEEMKAKFFEVFNAASKAEKAAIIEALETKDAVRMNEVTRPIIIRQAMREGNQARG